MALLVSSDAFTGQVERIKHNAREEDDKTLFAQFDAAKKEHHTSFIEYLNRGRDPAAKKEHNMGLKLLVVERAKNQDTEVLESVVTTAVLWEHEFLCTELKAIVNGRRRQMAKAAAKLNAFFVAIGRGLPPAPVCSRWISQISTSLV